MTRLTQERMTRLVRGARLSPLDFAGDAEYTVVVQRGEVLVVVRVKALIGGERLPVAEGGGSRAGAGEEHPRRDQRAA